MTRFVAGFGGASGVTTQPVRDRNLVSLGAGRTGCAVCVVSAFCILAAPTILLGSEGDPAGEQLRFRALPSLPDAGSLQGAALGTSNGALLAVGGTGRSRAREANQQPNAREDAVTVLFDPDEGWQAAGQLPEPFTFGGSANWNDGVLLIGGSSTKGGSAEVLFVKWSAEERRVVVRRMPPLPRPCARAGAAVLADTLYVAGGQASLEAAPAEKNFWALKLSEGASDGEWKSLVPWPGPARVRPVVAAQDGAVFVMGGFHPSGSNGEQAGRRYLDDAYRFTPK